MKSVLIPLFILNSLPALADITCEVDEGGSGKTETQQIIVKPGQDTHGSVTKLQLKLLPQVFGGWVALIGESLVISLYDVATGLSSSSSFPADQPGFQQMILPGTHHSKMQYVSVECNP